MIAPASRIDGVQQPPCDPRDLLGRLPSVRGRYALNVDLSGLTWFRVGGPAEIMFRPADVEDLALFLSASPSDIPVTVIGATSNLLVRDGGIPGVTVRLGAGFAEAEFAPDTVRFGAAMLDAAAARAALRHARRGLEFLSGIPGSIGGGLRMNAGAYGRNFSDILIEAEALDRRGQTHMIPRADMGMRYRGSGVDAGWIFTAARLRAAPGDTADIQRQMDDIRTARTASQPIRARTGGSSFANPGGADPDGVKSWRLIDRAHCRGLRVGGAMVSEQHCNFLINTGNATARDLEQLGEEVRRRVFEDSGIRLRWEIRRVGEGRVGDAPIDMGPTEEDPLDGGSTESGSLDGDPTDASPTDASSTDASSLESSAGKNIGEAGR